VHPTLILNVCAAAETHGICRERAVLLLMEKIAKYGGGESEPAGRRMWGGFRDYRSVDGPAEAAGPLVHWRRRGFLFVSHFTRVRGLLNLYLPRTDPSPAIL